MNKTMIGFGDLYNLDLEMMVMDKFSDSDEYRKLLQESNYDLYKLHGSIKELSIREEWKERVIESFEEYHNVYLDDSNEIFENWDDYFYD